METPTSSAVMALAIKHDLSLPYQVDVNNGEITIKYFGDRTDDAQALFVHGVGVYWKFDDNSDTEEFGASYDADTGQTTAVVTRR